MLPLWAIKWIIYGVIAAALLGCVAYVKHEWDAGQKARVQIAIVHKQEKAVTAAVGKADAAAGAQEAKAQAGLTEQTRVIIKRIPTYVTRSVPGKPVPCIPWGFVRLHDAAVLGVDPGSLPNPGGLADDACSTVEYPDLAGTVARNYGAARANAEQLDALIAAEKTRAAAANAAGAASLDTHR